MHVESFDPRSFHPKRTQISFPLSPQFGFELIALARRCITPRCVYYRCLSLSRCVCVPCRTRRAFSLLFHSFRLRPQRVPLPFAFPHLRLAIEPVRSHASLFSRALRQRREPVCTRTHSIPHPVVVAAVT